MHTCIVNFYSYKKNKYSHIFILKQSVQIPFKRNQKKQAQNFADRTRCPNRNLCSHQGVAEKKGMTRVKKKEKKKKGQKLSKESERKESPRLGIRFPGCGPTCQHSHETQRVADTWAPTRVFSSHLRFCRPSDPADGSGWFVAGPVDGGDSPK